ALAVRAIARIGRAQMTGMRRQLLLNCVKTYVKLNEAERSEMQAILEQNEYEDVRRDDWTWAGQLRAAGRDEERKEVVGRERQSLLEIYQGRFGQVPGGLAAELEQIEEPARLQSLVVVF